jgi:hypothetical protein
MSEMPIPMQVLARVTITSLLGLRLTSAAPRARLESKDVVRAAEWRDPFDWMARMCGVRQTLCASADSLL